MKPNQHTHTDRVHIMRMITAAFNGLFSFALHENVKCQSDDWLHPEAACVRACVCADVCVCANFPTSPS